MAPYPQDDFVEAWVGRPFREDSMSREPAMCDFWRASRNGQLYTIRGFSEDGLTRRAPGTCFDVTLPVWRVGEALLFAARLAETYEDIDEILVHCRYNGLRGRTLTSVTGQRLMFDSSVSQTDSITLEGKVTLQQIRDNLAEVLQGLLTPLYERFDFFRLSPILVAEETQRLQQGRF